MERELLVNAIETPDGTYLESRGRHDCRVHIDQITGERYMVDGGLAYRRRSVNKVPAKDCCVYTDDPHLKVRKAFRWGTYGKCGTKPLKLVALQDLTTDHIQAIIDQLPPGKILSIMLNELQYREEGGLESPEEGSY